jgi:adenine-specific DNA-methyltransferase
MALPVRPQDPYRAFLTADVALADYMAARLNLQPSDTLLEPAAGEGHLIDAAHAQLPTLPVIAYELNPDSAARLRHKYAGRPVEVVTGDAIFCPELDRRAAHGPRFDKILANPPYGGWQSYDRRAELKKRFPGFYVRETYTLFLLRCLGLLQEGGRLVFIVPDTFLYLHLHVALRQFILSNYSVERIDGFKSSLFPGVSFGYAGLCIITICARPPTPDHAIRLCQVDTVEQLGEEDNGRCRTIPQLPLLQATHCPIPLPAQPTLPLPAGDQPTLTMADVAHCVTGFYSGDDKRFLRKATPTVKRSQGYQVIEPAQIAPLPFAANPPLGGLGNPDCFVPVLKGGGYPFFKPVQWYVDWGETAVAHYQSDKKARFQNAAYYFRRGVGLPMVTSRRPTAALIEDALFDQSIVGIFPKGDVSLEFLLAYCNSLPFWLCLKAINPSANNSARYVLRTPIILPMATEQARITARVQELLPLLRIGDPSAASLQAEILAAINQYVAAEATNPALPAPIRHAIAQLF